MNIKYQLLTSGKNLTIEVLSVRLFIINSVGDEGRDSHSVIFLHCFLVVDRPAGEGNAGVLELFDLLFAVRLLVTVKADADCRIVKAFLKIFLIQLRHERIESDVGILLPDLCKSRAVKGND